jgi:hypothetical protein
MAEENYSTYQWEKADTHEIICIPTRENKTITVTANISHDNIFALIAGTYQVTVNVKYTITEKTRNPQESGTESDPEESNDDDVNINRQTKNLKVQCTTEKFNEPKLCIRKDESYQVILSLTGRISDNIDEGTIDEVEVTYDTGSFKIIEDGGDNPNKYLYILRMPELITNLSIDGRPADNTYVKGSALPINEIQNISTIDFHDITINNVQEDIFHKLDNDTNIATKTLVVPELTVVDLPESEDKPIIICKSRSKNKGVTFKTKDPEISNKHFGYIIDIKGYRSAGYNSVWVNRETLDEIFPNMPADIMSTTQMFECKDSFNFHELTYEVHNVAAPNWVNDSGQTFTSGDINTLKTYAPTYKAVTINQSTGDHIRHNDMLLKNIEFVKFGEKVIKLNYKPLYEA